MNAIAIWAINMYKKYISPKKGYSCYYRTSGRGESCSTRIKEMFETKPFLTALRNVKSEMSKCSLAKKEDHSCDLHATSYKRYVPHGQRGEVCIPDCDCNCDAPDCCKSSSSCGSSAVDSTSNSFFWLCLPDLCECGDNNRKHMNKKYKNKYRKGYYDCD